MHPILNTAVKAARRAGTLIVRYIDYADRLEVTEKGRNDFVSEVDEAAEAEIITVIKAAYPDHAIVAEESGTTAGREYEWVIDPLDGTTNFLHGYPQFAVSIAVRRNSELRHAVIFDPLKNELFTASKGDGAHLNNHRIRVSRVVRMRAALIGTGFPFKHLEHLDTWISTFKILITHSSGIRRAGSAALDLAYVACGRFDGFWEMGLKQWDMAAGCLLVEEAGGLITDFAGRQQHLATGNIIAGNPAIHPELLAVIRAQIPAN
ncbi:MAG: inositol monophosphatase [Gammaproteobacteria bacterium]|nr:inositol monophosphatase [Gammaproteobacteria bacterium]